jgi:phosphoserine phosphatase RsbU/P
MRRIFLLMAHHENRRLLRDWLSERYEAVAPESERPALEPADLCIVDGPALGRYGTLIEATKRAELPVFFPVLLVTHRQDVGLATGRLWKSVDELLISPVEKAELQARVEILLRVRNLSVENARLTLRLEAELARAGTVQEELLPTEVPELPGFELAARCLPARHVGGDFFDWQVRDGVLTLTVGDVMGKGMPAALLMATIRAALRAVADHRLPAAALEQARRALEADLVRVASFATLFHAQLDIGQSRLRYVDAGHGCACVLRSHGAVVPLTRGGPPLGVPSNQPYREDEIALHAGDSLIVYSDGLLEILPDLEDEDQAALAALLHGAESAAAMVVRLLERAADPPSDDLTLLVLRRCLAIGSAAQSRRESSPSDT